jgi:hypothetical protein
MLAIVVIFETLGFIVGQVVRPPCLSFPFAFTVQLVEPSAVMRSPSGS